MVNASTHARNLLLSEIGEQENPAAAALQDQVSGLDALRDVVRRLRDDELLSAEQRRYLAKGFETYVMETEAGVAASLDRAFGLRQRGGISPARAAVLQRRDDLLRQLWRGHEAFRDQQPLVAAKLMYLSADRYQSTRWPREKNDLSAPSSEPAATWWRILRLDIAIPGTKRLQQILQREIQDGV